MGDILYRFVLVFGEEMRLRSLCMRENGGGPLCIYRERKRTMIARKGSAALYIESNN